MDLWEGIATERLALAALAEELTPTEWSTPSLCGEWTVRDVVGHLVAPLRTGMAGFAVLFLRAGANPHKANQLAASREAARRTEDLVAGLRDGATNRFAPPGLGPAAPYTDLLIHGEDIRVPLDRTADRSPDAWQPALQFVTGPKGRLGFVSGGLPAVRLVATDTDWSHGDGPEVRGPAGALVLALTGRSARLDELDGPGTSVVRERLGR